MRFLTIYKAVERNQPPTQAHMDAMNALIAEMTQAGVLLSTEGCLPSKLGARVRRGGDEVTVTDGPFTESKELIAGVAIIEAKSKEEAIAWTKRFLAAAGDGESEIRQLYERPAQAPERAPGTGMREERPRASSA